MIYIQYEFFTADEVKRDAIISLLPEIGFDGFEELDLSVKGFIPEKDLNKQILSEIMSANDLEGVKYEFVTIAPKNWNEEWEKNFQPLTIADQVSIRAPFHERQPAAYELIIEPKMSFGTGHHATTAMMIKQMLLLDMKGKSVVDFGSGTGILAILAEKLGAEKILAIDHEEWAIENSKENLGRNNAVKVTVHMADSMDSAGQFDIMLANINRHVIMKYLESWRNFIKPDGVLVVSGILTADIYDVSDLALQSGFSVEKTMEQSGWASILFKNN